MENVVKDDSKSSVQVLCLKIFFKNTLDKQNWEVSFFRVWHGLICSTIYTCTPFQKVSDNRKYDRFTIWKYVECNIDSYNVELNIVYKYISSAKKNPHQ